MYGYTCVCVCVCVCAQRPRLRNQQAYKGVTKVSSVSCTRRKTFTSEARVPRVHLCTSTLDVDVRTIDVFCVVDMVLSVKFRNKQNF